MSLAFSIAIAIILVPLIIWAFAFFIPVAFIGGTVGIALIYRIVRSILGIVFAIVRTIFGLIGKVFNSKWFWIAFGIIFFIRFL